MKLQGAEKVRLNLAGMYSMLIGPLLAYLIPQTRNLGARPAGFHEKFALLSHYLRPVYPPAVNIVRNPLLIHLDTSQEVCKSSLRLPHMT